MILKHRMYRMFSAIFAVVLASAALLGAPATRAAGGDTDTSSAPTTVNFSNGVQIALLEVTYNDDDTSTWRYEVTKPATAQDATSWVLALPACATITEATPTDYSQVSADPETGLTGIKWDLASAGEFTLTLSGPVIVGAGEAGLGGADLSAVTLAGPTCASGSLPREVTLSNGYQVTFLGVTFEAGTSTWRYEMAELASAQDLSNWVLELPYCQIASASPSPWEAVHPDPNAQLYGIKWQTGAGFTQGEFTVTLAGPVTMGTAQVAAKGPDVVQDEILGVVSNGADCTSEPPAEIIIEEPKIEIKIENNMTFVFMMLDLENQGGRAEHTHLHIKIDQSFELADLSFLEGIGYVVENEGGMIKIGLGMYDTIEANGKLKLHFKFKAKNGKVKVKFKLKLHMTYDDSAGYVETEPVEAEQPDADDEGDAEDDQGDTDDEGDAEDDQGDADSDTGETEDDQSDEDAVDENAVVRLPLESIDVRFKARWESGGALRLYGYPISEPEVQDNGVLVQFFERARFEYHPENAGTEYEVLLGLLGVELGYGEPAVAEPTDEADQQWYFNETGHTISVEFRDFWTDNGGLMAFGYPIGEAFVDEHGLVVQNFERARFEYHPENAGTEYQVLLGFLGIEAMQQDQVE